MGTSSRLFVDFPMWPDEWRVELGPYQGTGLHHIQRPGPWREGSEWVDEFDGAGW